MKTHDGYIFFNTFFSQHFLHLSLLKLISINVAFIRTFHGKESLTPDEALKGDHMLNNEVIN